MDLRQNYFVKFMLVFVLTVPLSAVTVNPALCPTNKIAPHRRIRGWDWEYQPRTLGAFYDLLAPGGGAGNQPYNPSLQEEPQQDDPDDCGDIDDYDENDLSSLTPQYQTQQQYQVRKGYGDSKFFFGWFNNPQHPGQQPTRPPPPVPPRPDGSNNPNRPQRPPPGGYFGNNPYRPPILQSPSNEFKPVHEGYSETQDPTTYRPGVVGGPIGHVVGVVPVSVRPHQRPTRRPNFESATETSSYMSYSKPTESPVYTTRRPRPRNLNNDSILGSFIDLLFK